MSRIQKKNLILPTLLVLSGIEKIYDDYNLNFSGLTTSIVKNAVLTAIEDKLSEGDLEKLKNRNDRKIDQTFRNLISSKDLTDSGFVDISIEGKMRMTDDGFSMLFDYFNNRLERSNIKPFPELETPKKSVYNQLNSDYFPIRNKFIEEMNEKIMAVINARIEEKKSEQLKEKTSTHKRKIVR